MAFTLSQLQSLSRQAGWPENLVEKASALWMYESGGNPNAHNPRGEDSWGLAQVNWPFHKEYNRARLVEPLYNLQAAYSIYRREGWRAWYNSNIKYGNNYQGIAARARSIYLGQPQTAIVTPTTQSNPTVIYTHDTPIINLGSSPIDAPEPETDNSLLYAIGALLLLGLLA